MQEKDVVVAEPTHEAVEEAKQQASNDAQQPPQTQMNQTFTTFSSNVVKGTIKSQEGHTPNLQSNMQLPDAGQSEKSPSE